MSSRWLRFLLRLGIVIVVALLGLNLYINLKPAPKPLIDRPLVSLLPSAPVGWSATDAPIADTPEMQEQVESILHFDDAAYRLYDNGQTHIAVYVAHWLPGKFSPAKVGSHSPDTCWIHSGWDRVEHGQGVTEQLASGTLKPMETGTFEKNHERVYVIFCHLVGGTPMQYDLVDWQNGLSGRVQRLPAMFADFSRFGLDQRQEQLVFRISSNIAFEKLWGDPGFAQLFDQLSRSFDLYAKAPLATATSARTSINSDEVRPL